MNSCNEQNINNDDTNNTILRLLESKKNNVQESETQGYQDGKQWAKQTAKYVHLKRLSSYYENANKGCPIDYDKLMYHVCDNHNYDVDVFPVGAEIYNDVYLFNFLKGAFDIFKLVPKN